MEPLQKSFSLNAPNQNTSYKTSVLSNDSLSETLGKDLQLIKMYFREFHIIRLKMILMKSFETFFLKSENNV